MIGTQMYFLRWRKEAERQEGMKDGQAWAEVWLNKKSGYSVTEYFGKRISNNDWLISGAQTLFLPLLVAAAATTPTLPQGWAEYSRGFPLPLRCTNKSPTESC